jgi:hypothetical protein
MLCVVVVSKGRKEAKEVKRKGERRKIKIGLEERKNRNEEGREKVYYFMLVKGNVIQSIHYTLLEHSIVCRSLVHRRVKNHTIVKFFKCCILL